MKLTELKKIIKEEIERVLAEAPQTAPAKPETDTETKPKRKTSPEDDEFGTTPEPGTREKEKAEKAAEKVAEKIRNRYAKMLKNKK